MFHDSHQFTRKGIRFSDLFADTVKCHGIYWSATYYKKRGMPVWEFLYWLKVTRLGSMPLSH